MDKLGIALNKLNYKFRHKPLVVGGKAMEYYGLRPAGDDIDLIASEEDVIELIKLFPNRVKDIYSDLGVCPLEFEIWRTIQLFSYDDMRKNAVEEDEYLVISIENLLLMKALAIQKEKYLNDTKLIAQKISKDQYKNFKEEQQKVEEIVRNIGGNIVYIEKEGPTSILKLH